MYCPRCATPNADDTKFCRKCGTNLETVSLALADKLDASRLKKKDSQREITYEDLARKKSKGARDAVVGSIMLSAALLIGCGFVFLSNIADSIILWTIFFGWLAVWGAISLASGLGALVQAKTMTRVVEHVGSTNPLPASELKELPVAPSPSVTENTTKLISANPSQAEESN